MMKFLSQAWAALTSPNKATWDALAAAGQFSPFNAYVKVDQGRYSTGRAPTQTYPAGEVLPPLGTTITTAVGGIRLAAVNIASGAASAHWGVLLCRSLVTGFTPSAANCIAVLPFTGAAAIDYTDTPLVPDTYFYNCVGFGVDGLYGSAGTEGSAVVT